MKKLEAFIKELESKIPHHELVNPEVSKGSVGWHIEHSLLTLDVIIEALKRSNPDDYKWTLNFKRMLVYSIGKIPRGRAKAPTVVQPTADFNEETLTQHIATSKQKIKDLERLQSNHFFKHPFFGDLNLKPTLKFLHIHTKHHLAIIHDIIQSEKQVGKTSTNA